MRKILISVLLLTACGGGSNEELVCSLSSLSGTWRITYDEVDGNCGPISQETVTYSGEASPCDPLHREVSSDQCSLTTTSVCTLEDVELTWTIVYEQLETGYIEATGTLTANDGASTCRSTYDMTMTEL